MSRFGDARWQKLAVWSGAALAWGSAVTAAILEPARAGADPAQADEPAPVEMPSVQQPAIPVAPQSGLLVIRYNAAPDAGPAVKTVYVQKAAPSSSASAAAPAPAPAPAPPPPQPKSSGS